MSVLSDKEIQKQINAGQLVCDADPSNAEECSYAFRAGRAFLAGHQDEETNFVHDVSTTIIIDPGKMVWIRTRESVSLPDNLVGMWWQTNTLSKKGLMLVNMSMVEPGYKGSLACLFVNFGNLKIVIDGTMSIAKMVFIKISGQVISPYNKSQTIDEYDHALHELSVNQPSSFLQIGDIASGIENQRLKAIQEVEDKIKEGSRTLNAKTTTLESSIAAEFAKQKGIMIDEFKVDAPKAIWRSLGGAALVLVALGIVTALAGWTSNNFFKDTKAIAEEAAIKAVNDRVVIRASTGDESSLELEERLNKLSNRLSEIESMPTQ